MSTSVAPLSEGEQLKQKVAELSTMILDKHPKMPTLLREIHTTIRQYPEQVTLLDEAEINVIVSGLSVQTNTVFAASASKPAGVKSLAAKLKSNAAAALDL